jgi:3-oxoacyl-[acyl-carrier-protein] synthase-3
LALRFQHVSLAAIGSCLPEEVWTSAAIERALQPLYDRLKLPEGRLSLMSGIEQRRVWPAGTLPSGPSIESGRAALEAAGLAAEQVGCLVHASVCRDFLEPATASRVHHGLGLAEQCWVYDVSNACLGLLNGAVQIATLIEAGVIAAGLVVGTENSRPLLEQTIAHLNGEASLTRRSVKPAFASLTIGSGSCAWLLTHRDLAPAATRLECATAVARTAFHDLCRSDVDSAGATMAPLMDTDSEQLMAEGVATGVANFETLLSAAGLRREQLDRTVCHQVGGRHRQTMLAAMELDPARDVITYPWLGNTGSVALPLTLAAAAQFGELPAEAQLGLFGIGSGINSVMMTAHWGETPVAGNLPAASPVAVAGVP